MTVVRWNPVREMAAMQRMMERMFDEPWNNTSAENLKTLALDVHETADSYKVIAALPGVKAENIDVQYLERTLTITAEISEPEMPEGAKSLLNERYFGKYQRAVTLAQPVNSEHIQADYIDGILTLTLPKAESAKPRQIPVRTTITSSNN